MRVKGNVVLGGEEKRVREGRQVLKSTSEGHEGRDEDGLFEDKGGGEEE